MTKTTTKIHAALLLCATLPAGACFSERTTEPEDVTPCDGTITACTVSIIDNAFSPRTRHVVVGSTVRWTNNGASPHTVTGDAFDSGNLDDGQQFEETFTVAGEFDYVCEYHSDLMTGTVIVE